ncbi:MAG: acyl-CoA synthetase [Ilumatobacteraceae bacterium]
MTSLLPALDGTFGDRADAITIDTVTLSFAELAARADIVGSRIAGGGVVAVCATPSMDTVVAVAAGLRSGVAVVPVPPDAGPIERRHILHDSGAVAVLGHPDWPDVELPQVDLDDLTSKAVPLPPPDLDRTALIMYTSGTTGLPKGAVLSGRAIAADLDGLADAWAWTADDHLVHGLPLFHVHGLILGVLGALRTGSRLTHTGRPTPAAYAAASGSLYFGVPTVWSRVCAEPQMAESLSGARLLVSGSAPLPVTVFDRLVALTGHQPVERYGMTETLITLSTRADGERRPGWVGVPIPGIDTRVVADDGTICPHDGETIGGLQVRGATLFDGYLTGGRPSDFVDDWFVTGDAAAIDPDGFHRIAGRASVDIIKTGGFKVGAGEVESVLLDHPAVAEAAVIGVADDDLGQRVIAYVVSRDAVSAETLASFVGERLTAHKRPREIRIVDSLPRNAMGKVLKSVLATHHPA